MWYILFTMKFRIRKFFRQHPIAYLLLVFSLGFGVAGYFTMAEGSRIILSQDMSFHRDPSCGTMPTRAFGPCIWVQATMLDAVPFSNRWSFGLSTRLLVSDQKAEKAVFLSGRESNYYRDVLTDFVSGHRTLLVQLRFGQITRVSSRGQSIGNSLYVVDPRDQTSPVLAYGLFMYVVSVASLMTFVFLYVSSRSSNVTLGFIWRFVTSSRSV